jgi:hypothetical protein
MDFFDSSFLKDVISNLCATFIGAGLGIFTGLFLDRRKQISEEEAKKKELAVEANLRETKIIQLIKDEMIWNRGLLTEVQKSRRAFLLFEV